LPSADADHAFEPTFNVSDGSLLVNDGAGHLVKFFSLSPVLIPDHKFYGFTNEGGIIHTRKMRQSTVAVETESGITLAIVSIDPVSEAYLYRLGLDITVGRADSQGNLLTNEWIYHKNNIDLPVRFKVIPTVGDTGIPVGLHTADIGAISTATANGEDFTTTITRNDGSTLTSTWPAIKWRSYEPDIHTNWTDPLHPVLMLNTQVKQDVQRSLNNVEITQTLDVSTGLLTTTLTLHPNLGAPFDHVETVDFTELKIKWGNILGVITNQQDAVEYITQRLLPYELLANKVTSADANSTDDEYPSASALWNHAVPRADVPALVTTLTPQIVSSHELSRTKTWYDVPNRTLETETRSLTTDSHLLLAETTAPLGYELSVDMPALVSENTPNWLAVDPDTGNLRVDVTADLALKEDKANKVTGIDDTDKDSELHYPSNKAITEWSDGRYIHSDGTTAPQNPQTIGTGIQVAGTITIDRAGSDVPVARSTDGTDLILGGFEKSLSLEGSEVRPNYNTDTLALTADVDLKQDRQTFIDNPATINSPVCSVPDVNTIRIDWDEVNRANGDGAVTPKTQEIKTNDTIDVTGADTPELAVNVPNLISQDADNEIVAGTDGRLYNLNSMNKPLAPGYYLPIIYFDGVKVSYTYFQAPATDGTYQVQCIVTNGIPAWALV
jgi:hypothetical protein